MMENCFFLFLKDDGKSVIRLISYHIFIQL